MEWFEPRNFTEWVRRAFGFRPFLLILVVLCLMASELRFDWIEQVLGTYLVMTDSERPESGTIWESGHRKMTARKTLEKIITDRMAIQKEVREAETLLQIANSISAGKSGVMLSPEHFRSIYLKLTPSISQEILSPFEMIRILSEGQWDRTYFEKNENYLIVYFLDKDNRVLRQLEISTDLLYQSKHPEAERIGSLDNLAKFNNRIYPSDRFFAELGSLPEEVHKNIIAQPEDLLKLPGRIKRVGISDEAVSGYIELAFEIESGTQRKLFFVQGREWAVWLLRSNLEGKEPVSNQFVVNPTDRMETP